MKIQNKLISGLTYKFGIRYLSVDVSQIAEIARLKQSLPPKTALLCAEAIIASVLMSSQIKGEERISLHMQLEQPSASFMGDVTAEGHVRARFRCDSVSDDILKGVILVIKHNASREIYRGVTGVEHSSIQEALLEHMCSSAQIPSTLRCAVTQHEDGSIERAVGLLFELLPASDDFEEVTTETFIEHTKELSTMSIEALFEGIDSSHILGKELHAMNSLDLCWQCHCSQQRAESLLFSLGKAELTDMLTEEKPQEVICEFCNTHYIFDHQKIQALINEHS